MILNVELWPKPFSRPESIERDIAGTSQLVVIYKEMHLPTSWVRDMHYICIYIYMSIHTCFPGRTYTDPKVCRWVPSMGSFAQFLCDYEYLECADLRSEVLHIAVLAGSSGRTVLGQGCCDQSCGRQISERAQQNRPQ